MSFSPESFLLKNDAFILDDKYKKGFRKAKPFFMNNL